MVLKELILTVAHFGKCAGLERTDFEQFLYWDGAVILKELIFHSFAFGRLWWS